MREVLIKIDELQTLLEEKIRATEVLNAQLGVQKTEAERKAIIQSATNKRLAAQERIYKKYTDFDEAVKKFNANKVNYQSQIDKALAVEKSAKELLKLAREEKKVVDSKEKALATKIIALKSRQADFDKKKVELKAMISGEAIKEMLK